MLLVVLALATLILGVLLVRWALGRSAPILIGLTVVVVLGSGFFEYRWRAAEHGFTVATRKLIARTDVHVHCQRLTATLVDASGYEGYVPYPGDGSLPRTADLMWTTCHNLAKWQRSGHKATAPKAQIVAIHVLTHEAMHLTGEKNEAKAECLAMQHDAETARLLGASTRAASAIAERYWREDYPHMRDDYRTGDCAPGGALDLHPETPAWPTG